MTLEIRQEIPNDYDTVYNVIKSAFATAEHRDGNEQDLVTALRKSNNFIPELSLVAVENSKLVGYILFTEIQVGETKAVALAPLAVAPEYQGRGIGSQLVATGHKIAKELGYHYSVVLGSEKYYPRFGYLPAVQFGIQAPFKVASKNYMVKKLNNTNQAIHGTVKYAKEFGL